MPTIPPPDVPAGLDPKATDFLRRFRTWAMNELDRKASVNEAIPQLLFLAAGAKPPAQVYKLTIDGTGAVVVAPVPLGGGGTG